MMARRDESQARIGWPAPALAAVAPAQPLPHQNPEHAMLANAIRALAMDAVEQAKSGHPGMPMGMADVATVLYQRFLKFDAAAPDWPDRDRFVLSAGHGSMLLYALLYLTGYADMSIDDIKAAVSQDRGPSRARPAASIGPRPGHSARTSPTPSAWLAERWLAARFGEQVVDHYTYVVAGDGCLMEGISHEAASLAGHLRLNKLIVLFDDNHISIDGTTELTVSDDQCARFEAYGWAVARVDGHEPDSIAAAIEAARRSERPSFIACRTTIAFGAPTKAAPRRRTARRWRQEIAGTRARPGGRRRRSRFPTTSSRAGARSDRAVPKAVRRGSGASRHCPKRTAMNFAACSTASCRPTGLRGSTRSRRS
jgi:transketolase